MFTVKVAVCSEICTKYINAIWALWRIVECWTWSYVKLPLGFKRLRDITYVLQFCSVLMIPCNRTSLWLHVLCDPWTNHLAGCVTAQVVSSELVTVSPWFSPQFMWVLRWTEWYWNMFLSEYSGLPLFVSFQQCFTFIFCLRHHTFWILTCCWINQNHTYESFFHLTLYSVQWEPG
jgi:hypothetical protein